jgi:hypothetical protein
MSNQEIQLQPPCWVRYGNKSLRAGPTVYHALRALLAAGAAGVELPKFCESVWGVIPEHAETIRGVVWRLNELLKELGCLRRAMMDHDRVVLDGTGEGPALAG